MHTIDGVEGNVERIAALFPNCVTEAVDDQGNLRHVVDFDKLKVELGEVVEGPEERYQFTWPGKRDAIRLANSPIAATLRPVREDSVDFDNTQNLYIEGDNLDVLKLLRETYLGKVKMIYIDPPYNTGNDFVYEDDFSQAAGDYLANSVQYDDQGNRLVANTESNGRFHTDWLNMIYPRLKVARDLLTEDGTIFITLDDHEYSNAKKVCDEIFGINNFVATIIWENFYGRSNAAAISPAHNYILLYSKAGENWKYIRKLLPRDENELKQKLIYLLNDPNGAWRLGPIFASGERHAGLMYTIQTPNGDSITPPKGSHWRMLESEFWKRVAEGSIVFGMDGKGAPATKLYLSEVQQGLVPRSIWLHDEAGHTQDGKRELMGIFPEASVFDTPKPIKLIHLITKIACGKSDYILDFFSGSATTAHAVMQLNAEDGGNRKFIMVQLPETTDVKSEAYKAGYKTICEIGKERIRRAGKKIKADAGLMGQDLDIGFRVLRLDSSNMEDVYYTPDQFDPNTIQGLMDNVKADRSEEDLLFQVMLELDIPLSASIQQEQIAGKRVFNVADGHLIATFDRDINETTVTEVARRKPNFFVMRDASAANDNVLDNFDKIFHHYSPDTTCKIL